MEENQNLNAAPSAPVGTNAMPATSAPTPDATNITPAATPELEQEGNGDAITFDYNQLYQSNEANEATPEGQAINTNPSVTETPIALETKKPEPTPVVSDIIPTFDTNALEDDLPDDLKPKVEEPLIHTMATETQKEKQEGRQNLLFIIIFFAVLIIAVLVIFPMMLGI